MSTELDHLRAFRADDAAPDPAARAAPRAALLERIEAPTPAGDARRRASRHSRRRLLAGGLSLASVAAAALALVSGLGSEGVRPPEASAAQLLRRAAVVAAHEPDVALKRGQFWYARSVSRQGNERGRELREVWFDAVGSGRVVQHGRHPEDFTISRRGPHGRELYSFFPHGLTYRQLRALPTATGALYARIARAGTIWAKGNGRPAADRRFEMFTIVGDWLKTAPPPSPALRAALYRVAARLPGIELLGAVRDPRGRRGVAVAMVRDRLREELVFDPDTARLLAQRIVHMPSGRLFFESTLLASGVVDSMRARP
jgi:hypothetical protein